MADKVLSRDVALAVLIPCFNEQESIGTVIAGFNAALPTARVYVFDNNSTDDTAKAAENAGAIVRHEKVQGKGNVVRRMFADVEADIYIMVDGDATYDARSAKTMVELLIANRLDMVVGSRLATADDAYRRGHRFGNRLLTRTVARLVRQSIFGHVVGLSSVFQALRKVISSHVQRIRNRNRADDSRVGSVPSGS